MMSLNEIRRIRFEAQMRKAIKAEAWRQMWRHAILTILTAMGLIAVLGAVAALACAYNAECRAGREAAHAHYERVAFEGGR